MWRLLAMLAVVGALVGCGEGGGEDGSTPTVFNGCDERALAVDVGAKLGSDWLCEGAGCVLCGEVGTDRDVLFRETRRDFSQGVCEHEIFDENEDGIDLDGASPVNACLETLE